MDEGLRKSRKSAPKFASFRPAHTKLDHGVSSPAQGPNATKKSQRDPGFIQSKDHEKRDKTFLTKVHDDAKASKPKEKPHHSLEDLAEAGGQTRPHTSQSFRIDRLGDPKNLLYGALDRYSVPAYIRRGGGRVLGSAQGLRIDRDASSDKGLILSLNGRLHESLKNDLNAASIRWPQSSELIKVQGAPDQTDNTRDFVPLDNRKSTRHDTTDHEISSSSDTGPDESRFRTSFPLESRVPRASFIGSQKREVSEEDNDQRRPSENDELLNKSANLNRLVQLDPKNGALWLDLIQYQEQSLGSKPTAAERQSIADIKVLLAEKALRVVDMTQFRQQIILQKMRDTAQIRSNQSLLSEWKAVLQENPDMPLLCLAYLELRQNDFSSFKYEDFQATCREHLDMLRQAFFRATEASERMILYEIQLLLIVKVTFCMRESGFSEHALAIWQAILEYEFFQPRRFNDVDQASYGAKNKDKGLEFEAFWDSELPRIGEEHARGWTAHILEPQHLRGPRTDVLEKQETLIDVFRAWISIEGVASVLSRRPARTFDETPENDPFRVILFPDIEPFLIESPNFNGRLLLLNAFLFFFGLPNRLGELAPNLRLDQDVLLPSALRVGENLGSCQIRKTSNDRHVQHGIDSRQQKSERNASKMPRYFPTDTSSLFARSDSIHRAFEADQALEDFRWTIQTLKMVIGVFDPDDEIAEYAIAFEASQSLDAAKKTAKRFLKTRTSSLRLYNAYALIEWRSGNASKAELTFVSALNMFCDLPDGSRKDCILLWSSWIWELVFSGMTARASSQIQQFGNEVIHLTEPNSEGAVTQEQVIRCKKLLEVFRGDLLIEGEHRHARLAMECLILLAYLSDGSSIQAARTEFESNLELLPTDTSSIGLQREFLYQSMARLIHTQAKHSHDFKPAINREILARGITEFAQNTILLQVYEWNERSFRIHDRLRSILDDVVLRPNLAAPQQQQQQQQEEQQSGMPRMPNLAGHLFAIHSEQTRGELGGSNIHTIRASLERAVQSEAGAHCGTLWAQYIHFERQQSGDLKRAKAIFYRAIQACPWTKQLYMLAFAYLRSSCTKADRSGKKRGIGINDDNGGLTDSELKGVYDVMLAKELRIHVDLDEMIDHRREQEEQE